MSLDFLTRAFLVGAGIALVSGPLGSLIVWRRMSNLGDTLAHSSLLGIVLALLFGLPIFFGVIGLGLAIGFLLWILSKQKKLTSDAALVVIAQSALAFGLIIASTLKGVRFDLFSYLFGDILTVTQTDIFWVITIDSIVIATLLLVWNSLLSITVHEELARVEGVWVGTLNFVFLSLIILVFAISIQLVGVLLMTALLIIPAFSAAHFTKTPEQMMVASSLLGIIAVGLGMYFSVQLDWPTGPTIVAALFGLLVVSQVLSLGVKQ